MLFYALQISKLSCSLFLNSFFYKKIQLPRLRIFLKLLVPQCPVTLEEPVC